jgi:hypothetical protein
MQQTWAQGTDAGIQVSVRNQQKELLPGATITITNLSTGFNSTAVTDKDGRYRFLQIPLGGPYSIKVQYIGFQPLEQKGYMLSQGSNLQVNIVMESSTTQLREVNIQHSEFKSRDERLSKSTAINAKEIQRLPTANRNFGNLAQLSPMVGSDLNVGGISSRNDAVTIDGVTGRESSFGGPDQMPYTLSMEALREFEVVTNVYDVTEGRSSAGAVKAVTKSGTNEFHGSVFSYFWDSRLAAQQDLLGRDVINDTKQQRGFSLGGPIIRNKVHFFVAYDGERLDQAYDLWAKSTREGVMQSNEGHLVTKPVLDSAITILQQKYGVSSRPQYGFFTRTNKLDTYFGKIDWQINGRHKLTVRYNQSDYIQPNNTNSDIGRYGIYDAGYDFIVKGKNALVALRSQLNNDLSNEFKAGYYYNTRQNAINTAEHPQLWMTLQSVIDGQQYNATLVGRYNRWVPEIQENKTWSLINDTYWKKGRFNFVFGTQNSYTQTSGIYTHDIKGRFDFNSLDALDKMQASRYRRKFTNPGQELRDPVSTGLTELAAYAQASTEIRPDMKVSFGLRYDVAIFSKAADYNALLDQELGYNNNSKPVDANNIQPRFNFSWNVGGKGRDLIDAGFGWFTGQMVTRPYIYALIDNGIRFTGIDITGRDGYIIDPRTNDFLIKNGQRVAMPKPDYNAYDKDYNTIPGTGYTNEELFGAGQQSQVVRFVDDNLQLPTSFKANISYHRYLTDWLRVGASGYLIHTKNMLVMDNANLTNKVAFTLEGEGGREIYTPLANMKSNAADFNTAKRSQQFSEALRFTNGYTNRTMGMIIDAAMQLPKEGALTISYTRAQAKGAERFRNEDDQRFVGASYFDDYKFINDGYSPYDFRQKILVNITSPKVGGFTFGAFLNMVETGRFSAILSPGDVMGTNIRELRGYAAYIFDPNDPRTLEFQGQKFVDDLKFVMTNAGPAAQKYLKDNIGKYAQPNGGLMGWRTTLNARITNDIVLYKQHRLVLNIDCFNVLNLIKSDWGGYWNYPYEELYKVTAFDAARRSYQYEVNRNYGERRKEGSGFVLMFGVKYVF